MVLKKARQRVADLKAELARAKRAISDLGTAAINEKRALTDDERATIAAANASANTLEDQLVDAEAILRAAEEANEAERHADAGQPDPDAQTAQRAAASAGIRVGEDALDKAAKAPGFFGRELQAVRRAALSLKGGDESLTADDRMILRRMNAVATGLNTDVPSEGGYLVGPERSTTILQRIYQTGQVLSRVNRMPIGPNSNGMKFPAIDETSRANNSRFGGIISGWLGQGNTLTAGKPKFREIELKLRKSGAFVYATDEMLEDAIALEGWVNRNLPLELTFRTEDAVFNGLGSTEPLGLLSNPALITVTRSTANHVISDDMRGMWKRMWSGARGNAVWFYDQSIEDDFDQFAIPIGTGGVLDPSYKPAGSVPGQEFATYKGRPMIPVEYCANIGTTGDIVLTNLDEYILIDKGGVNQAVSLHVAFLTDEAVYRFIYRVDGQLSWNAPLTPKSGGSTLSCAVVLS